MATENPTLELSKKLREALDVLPNVTLSGMLKDEDAAFVALHLTNDLNTKGVLLFTKLQFHIISLLVMFPESLEDCGFTNMTFYPKNSYVVCRDVQLKLLFMSEVIEYFKISFNANFAKDWVNFDKEAQKTDGNFVKFSFGDGKKIPPTFSIYNPSNGINICKCVHVGGGRQWSANHAQPYILSVFMPTSQTPIEPLQAFPFGESIRINIDKPLLGIHASCFFTSPSWPLVEKSLLKLLYQLQTIGELKIYIYIKISVFFRFTAKKNHFTKKYFLFNFRLLTTRVSTIFLKN